MLEDANWLEARQLLLDRVIPVEIEYAPLEICGGRVLAFDLKAAEEAKRQIGPHMATREAC